eukprot:219834-Pyramimonas_sp.AAC.1
MPSHAAHAYLFSISRGLDNSPFSFSHVLLNIRLATSVSRQASRVKVPRGNDRDSCVMLVLQLCRRSSNEADQWRDMSMCEGTTRWG